MSSNIRSRRNTASAGMAASTVFATALLSLAHVPVAGADPDQDPFVDLYGFNAAGINAWTHAADDSLATNAPGLATSLDGLVDAFNAADADPFSDWANAIDPAAFSPNGLPTDGLGDFAVTLDYLLWPTGLGALLDPVVDSMLSSMGMGA
jgi:hypothetical protein